MLNLLRMDLYRMFRSKSFYVFLGILIFISFFSFGFLYVIANPGAQDYLAQRGMSLVDFQGDTGYDLSSMSILDIFHQASIAGGFFSVMIGIFSTLFVGGDFENGFIKNIICAHHNKWSYIVAKLLCLGIANLIYLSGPLFCSVLINLILGNFFSAVSIVSVAYYILAVWLIACAFSALSLLIINATRSKSAGVSAAIFINGGPVLQVVSLILGLFNLNRLTEYTLYYSLANMAIPTNSTAILRPILTALCFLVVYTFISKLLLSKKDL